MRMEKPPLGAVFLRSVRRRREAGRLQSGRNSNRRDADPCGEAAMFSLPGSDS